MRTDHQKVALIWLTRNKVSEKVEDSLSSQMIRNLEKRYQFNTKARIHLLCTILSLKEVPKIQEQIWIMISILRDLGLTAFLEGPCQLIAPVLLPMISIIKLQTLVKIVIQSNLQEINWKCRQQSSKIDLISQRNFTLRNTRRIN